MKFFHFLTFYMWNNPITPYHQKGRAYSTKQNKLENPLAKRTIILEIAVAIFVLSINSLEDCQSQSLSLRVTLTILD